MTSVFREIGTLLCFVYFFRSGGTPVLLECPPVDVTFAMLAKHRRYSSRYQLFGVETNIDRIPKILGWKTIHLIPEIFVQ
jgi:hypothetical protein